MFSMQSRENIAAEYNKKRMNVANFLNIYTNIYFYIICDEILMIQKTQYCSIVVLLTIITV